ncbi:MAG: hypothetical protein V3V96_17440 [Acidiferrobacterales bacterium]
MSDAESVPRWDDDFDEDRDNCPSCGGSGRREYIECPEAWGEDCPSELNHMITCPNCGGSGAAKDCTSW